MTSKDCNRYDCRGPNGRTLKCVEDGSVTETKRVVELALGGHSVQYWRLMSSFTCLLKKLIEPVEPEKEKKEITTMYLQILCLVNLLYPLIFPLFFMVRFW